MIYLIGGPSRSGKTILAKKLQEKTGAYLIPLDYVEAAVTEYYPKEQLDVLRPFSVMRKETNRDSNLLVKQYSIQEIIDAYEKQAQSMFPGIEAIINYELQRNESIIIEGYQITIKLVASVIEKFDSEQIRPIFLVKEDIDLILDGWKHAPENDWLFRDSDENTLRKYAELTAEYGKLFAKSSKENNYLCINTDSEFEKKIDEALVFLMNTNP